MQKKVYQTYIFSKSFKNGTETNYFVLLFNTSQIIQISLKTNKIRYGYSE